MLAIETTIRLRDEVRSLPTASRVGLAVTFVAGLMDVAVHLLGSDGGAHQHSFAAEHAAHLLGIVGMVLVLSGVVIYGARRHLRRRHAAPITGGLETNAPR